MGADGGISIKLYTVYTGWESLMDGMFFSYKGIFDTKEGALEYLKTFKNFDQAEILREGRYRFLTSHWIIEEHILNQGSL